MTSGTDQPTELVATTSLDAAIRAAVPTEAGPVVEVGETVDGAALAQAGVVVLTTPLDRLDDPLTLLRAVRRAVGDDTLVVCGTTNGTDATALVQLLRSDPRQESYAAARRLSTGHELGYATAYKLLLEAGLSLDVVTTLGEQPDEDLLAAAEPLLAHLRVDVERARHHLGATGYVFRGRKVAGLPDDDGDVVPLTFVACVNDDAQLLNNLLASPALADGTPHQLLTYRDMGSAAAGLNRGLAEAEHELVVMIQQDIYVPSWWPARLVAQWRKACADGPEPAIGGPFGVRYREGSREHVGHAVDRDHLLREPSPLPADVDGLDELVLVVPRSIVSTELRFAPAVGWHLYGTDFALQAHRAGRRVVVVDAPVVHNSLFHSLDGAYRHAEAQLATLWPQELPIMTNSSSIDEDPRDARMRAMEEVIEHARVTIEALNEQVELARGRTLAQREKTRKLREKLKAARGDGAANPEDDDE